MGRIPDHLVSLAFRALENRWVTIGAKVGKNTNGKKKGGTPVELDGEGKITKGPAALTGKRPSELSQSHLFTGQDHKSQRKLFAEPGDPPPPPPIEETPKAPPAAAKKEPKPRAKKPLSMSLLAVIRREGGISSGDFEHADFKEFGLLGALNKKGLSLDDMAATMVRQGHITVPMGKSSPSDHLLQLLKKKTNSLLAADTAEYDKDYEAYMQAREEAHADGYPEEQLAEASGRGTEAGDQESANRIFEEIFGGDGGGGEEASRDEEPGDLAGDSAEPASGLDTSFDFGPAAAPKVEEKPKAAKPKKAAKQDKPAPAPAPPAIEPQAPAAPPAIDPKPAKKEDHEMTSAEYLRNGRPNFGDMVLTPYGKLGIMSGGGTMGSNRVKVKGVWHDRDDLKLIRRPDKDVNQNLSGEWKAKQKADLAQIDKDHGVILHKKSMVDSAKKRLQAGTMTQDQYDNFVGTGFYKMTDDEVAQAEKAQAEIDAIKDRPLEFEQSVHSLRVANALASGKDVPANVLAEYPDLAKKYGKDKAQPAPATTPPPPPPATNLFGQPEPTKPQPATTQGLFGTQVPVEDPKVKPRETVADQAEKGLDWLYQKQDPKTDGTGEMFGGLFSPGRTSGATEPEAGPVAPPAVEPSATAAKPKVTPPAPKTPYAQRRGSVNFSPVTGPTGHKLVGYNWEHDKVDMVDDRGENRTRKVSAWDRSTQADETNRPIVHSFTVEAPDGTTKTVSLETAARMLGFDSSGDEPKAKFQSAVSAAKTLAKMQMDRADLVQRADRWQKDKADVDRQVEALPDDQIEEVPDTFGRPEYRVFRWKNQPEISVRRRMNQPEADREEGKRQVRWALADSEMEKRGHKEKNFKPNTAKIDGDIKKAQEKLDNLTKQASQTKPEAGPAAPPPIEPSPPSTNPKATSLPDRIKNLNVLLNKTRSSANAKALRTAIAQLEREAGPAEPPKIEPASPAAPQAPANAEFDPASPPGVSDKDIPLDLAYNAHRGTSFVPEKRAQARVEEYVNDMKGIWSDLAKMATTPEQQATLKDEFERFRKGYVEKNKAMLSAMSRQVSSMIAGPARFPVDRMRKRANTADNRREEFLEFRKKAIASIQRKLDPSTNGIRQAAPDASNQLNSKATELRKKQEKMKAANNLIRKELKTNRPQNVTPQQSEKLKAGLAAIGLDAREVSSILKPDYMGQIGYQDFMLRNNLANIKRQEQRQAEVQQFQQSAPQSPETEYDGGVTVTEHPEDQRIRIKFPGKPNSEQIRELKARGFKWAPSQKAWSRVLTSNARTAAQSIMKELGLNKVGADTTTESRTLSTIRQQLREAFRQCP